MQKLSILLVALVLAIPLTTVQAKERQWKRIYPVAKCPQFHMLYYRDGNRYFLTYPVTSANGRTRNYKPYISINSINDLSSITDIVVEQVNIKCNIPIVPSSGDVGCDSNQQLSSEFITLIQSASNAVAAISDNCQEITRYIELQDKIEGLDSNNPVEIQSSTNLGNMILKIFADSTSDDLIDHFNACGGKKSSHRFVENLLLIESHKACIMPSPPGVLSWDEMRAVAKSVASRHRNTSILDIKEQKAQIEKEALIEITKAASLKQIKDLMPEADAEKVLNSLKSYRHLQENRNMANLKEYINLVYTIDITIELSEISLKHLVEQQMYEKLPADWSAKHKRDYMFNHLIPLARKGYNECMDKPKVQSNYLHDAPGEANLNFRQWQKNEFCKKNVAHCRKAEAFDCHSKEPAPSINLLSNNIHTTDADLAKSCVLNGIVQLIHPLLKVTMESEVKKYEEDVELPKGMATEFANVAWKNFKSCVNTHPAMKVIYPSNVFQPIYIEGDRTSSKPLEKLTPDQFVKMLGDCSDEVEDKITIDFIESIFIANENVHGPRTYGNMVNFHGKEYPAEATLYTQQKVRENMNLCYEKQRLHHKDEAEFKPNPALCTPLLEIVVSKETIFNKIRDIFNNASIAFDPKPQLILSNFRRCVEDSKTTMLDAMGNPKARPSLNGPHDGKTYLDRNNQFYQCVETALIDTTKVVAEERYKEEIRKKRKTLHNYRNILGWSDDVGKVVQSCFKKGISGIKNWTKFKEFNSADGMDKLEQRCSDEANRFILPKIMYAESYSSIKKLKDQNLLENNSEIGLILNQAVSDISQVYDVNVPKNVKGKDRFHQSMSLAIGTYQSRHPGASLDAFLDEFESKVTNRAVTRIRSRFVDNIKEKARKTYNLDLSELDTVLPNQCVLNLYNNLKDDLSKQSSSKEKESDINETIEQIVDGFHYISQVPGQLASKMNQISNFCKNYKKYRTMDQVERSGLLDMVVKARIQKEVYDSYRKMAIEAYDADKKKYSHQGDYSQVQPFIEKKYKDMLALIDDQIKNTANFERLMFPSTPSGIIQYSLSNLDDITVEGSAANKRLNSLVVGQMFRNRSKGGFASRFAEIQIVNAVGVSGFYSAKKNLWDKVSKEHPSIRDTAYKNGMQSLRRNWNITKVHDRFGWNNLPDYSRRGLIDSIYDHAVIPVATNQSDAAVTKHREQLSDKVNDHLEKWHNGGKTFSDLFSDEIASETEDAIWDSPWNAAGEAVSRWLDF